jgi:molecular chaperone HtpG
MKEYDGKQLICVTKEGVKFEESEEEKQTFEELTKTFEPLTKYMKDVLGGKVEKVTLSDRITDTPCVLVTGEFGWSANMERIMKAQALRDNNMSSFMMSRKTLEINPHNVIINEFKTRHTNDANDKTLKDLVNLMFESSLINSGFTLDEPSAFVNRINNMIKLGLNLDDDEDTSLPEPEMTTSTDEDNTMEQVD